MNATMSEAYLTKRTGRRNPVAKNMDKFNRPQTHKDKKHDYSRKSRTAKDDFKNPDNWYR